MASQSTKIAGLPFIPKKYSVVERAGKAYVTTKGRKKYKMPAKARKKIAAAARRTKFPLLTMGAVSVPIVKAVGNAQSHGGFFSASGFQEFGSSMLAYYTGFYPIAGDWKFSRLMYGLLPLGAVFLVNKTGLLKPVNQKLAKIKGNPFRIN